MTSEGWGGGIHTFSIIISAEVSKKKDLSWNLPHLHTNENKITRNDKMDTIKKSIVMNRCCKERDDIPVETFFFFL